jgi:hypothetical protein
MTKRKIVDRLAAIEWAEDEFGAADLGDSKRTRRLVLMGAKAVLDPGGTVASVFRKPADRQAAYDFLQDERLSFAPIVRGLATACALRAAEHAFVYVPVDLCTLHLTDLEKMKYGRIGDHGCSARGIKVANAIAVDPQGVPIGVAWQHYWIREGIVTVHRNERSVQEKETRY